MPGIAEDREESEKEKKHFSRRARDWCLQWNRENNACMRLPCNYTGANVVRKMELYARADLREPVTCHPSQVCVYWHPVRSLKLSMMEQFTPRKLANPRNQGFCIFFVFVFPQRAGCYTFLSRPVEIYSDKSMFFRREGSIILNLSSPQTQAIIKQRNEAKFELSFWH